MIEIIGLSKRFETSTALAGLDVVIPEGSIFGVIGSNGSGKSTLLRAIAGIYRPNEGEVLVDGESVYENPDAKRKIFTLSDEQYFLAGSGIEENAKFLATVYPNFNMEGCMTLAESLKLSPKKKVATFSKGMKKQAAMILGVSAGTKYILCDETFDGLDTMMRQLAKRIFAAAVAEGTLTPIIASHDLREVEDICDRVLVLHQGRKVFSSELDELRMGAHKIQCVSRTQLDESSFAGLNIRDFQQRGSIYTAVVRGEKEQVEETLGTLPLEFVEIVPMTLDEIFIYSMEEKGYDFKHLLQ